VHREESWFYGVVLLPTDTYRLCFLDNPQKIRINHLDMIGAILGFAAALTLMAAPTAHHDPAIHRPIVDAPPCPQLATSEDNTVAKSWTMKNAAKLPLKIGSPTRSPYHLPQPNKHQTRRH
jgi:hypothetical protein